MKWHFYTVDNAPFSYDEIMPIKCIDEIEVIENFKDEFEYKDDINLDALCNYLFEEHYDELMDELDDIFASNSLQSTISQLYEYPNSGKFDWNEETVKYYEVFARMAKFIQCELTLNSAELLHKFNCSFGESFGFDVSSSKLTFSFGWFYSGNGEPAGAQLALDIADRFMRIGEWHIGFYDIDGSLISDISSWSKDNVLDIKNIKPIVWFGTSNVITDCWSISTKTTDEALKEFWGDYFEGALISICRADEGIGIYYSVWEYGLEYDEDLFNSIKECCPISLSAQKDVRIEEMFNKIISLYNEHRDVKFPEITEISY